MGENRLPTWIVELLEEIEGNLSKRSRKHFTPFTEAHALLVSTLEDLSPKATILEIKDTSPQFLQRRFGDAYKGLALCVESFSFQWGYQNFFKLQAWTSGLSKSLDDANFLMAASSCRGLFEQICHFDFYLSRFEKLAEKTTILWQNERKNILKGKMPGDRWRQAYVQAPVEVIQYALKAMRGSDYDWRAWRVQALESAGVERAKEQPHEQDRKTHINSCIEAVEKKHHIEIAGHYDILCDLVHPNFGSNTLVVVTREDLGDQLGHVELSSTPKNEEAAAWFFEVLSEPMHKVMEIAEKDIHLANQMMRFFQEQAIGLAGPKATLPPR